MLTDEELRNAPPYGRVLRFAIRLVSVLKPVLRWPIGLLLRNSPAAALGRTHRLRDDGKFQEGWTTAIEALQRLSPKPASLRSFLWWQLVAAAAQCGAELGGQERAALEHLLTQAPEPGGMMAAQAFASLARAGWRAGDREGAIKAARLAVDADATWAHGHVLLGWYGLVTQGFDPLPHLRAAVVADPGALAEIRTIPEFANAPGLLDLLPI
jgi:hypothetical protein